MSDKKINDIPVSDDVFNKMVFLQERARRIEAESRLLFREKTETEASIKELMGLIEKSRHAPETTSTNLSAVVSASGNNATA